MISGDKVNLFSDKNGCLGKITFGKILKHIALKFKDTLGGKNKIVSLRNFK